MIISGLAIQKKRTLNKHLSSLHKKKQYQTRPLSSQLPQLSQPHKRSSHINLIGSKKHSKNKNQDIDGIVQQQKRQNNQSIPKNRIRHTSSNKLSQLTSNKIKSYKSHLSSQKDIQCYTSQQKQMQQTKLGQIKEHLSPQNMTTNLTPSNRVTKKKLQLYNKQNNKISSSLGLNNNTTKLVIFDQIQKQKILKYYRYYPITIIQTCGKREQFMKSLTQNGDFQTYNIIKYKKSKSQIIIDCYQPWNKLIKIAQLKGKYKYREKFNFVYNAQLKAINFKRKQIKKKKQSSSSSEEEQQKKQKCRDLQTWKKSMGVQGAKVFIVKGKYPDFRNALIQRGWVQNPDKHSSFFDLKWTTKVSDLTFQTLKPYQIVNHFNNNACLTSKYGICKSLRSVMYTQQVDIDKFFPKAFDLTDQGDFQNFLEIYKWVYCQSIIKQYLNYKDKINKLQQNHQPVNNDNINTNNIYANNFNNVNIIKLSLIALNRRFTKAEHLIKNTLLEKYSLSSISEWLAIIDPQKINYSQFDQLYQIWDLVSNNQQLLTLKCKQILSKLHQFDPQTNLNGYRNIWIVKPAFLSRGRGIKCLNKFNDILNYSLGKQTQYVVQKYIQNPLIINKKKFDIRQWVIVQDYNPPKIWIYGQFYCRFCIQQYDQNKITNKFAHLTNNSIQKYNKNLSAAELKQQLKNSMWTQQQLQEWIQQNYQPGSFKIILNKLKQIVISTVLSTADQVYGRKNSFQLIGYDFMIDDNLNPWLIQINTSPSMDHSTPVTARLVKMVLQDTVKVMVDVTVKKKGKNSKKAGLFKLVYNGQNKFVSKYYPLIKQNKDE